MKSRWRNSTDSSLSISVVFAKMRDHRGADTYHGIVTDGHELWLRGFDNGVVADPDTLSDFDPAPTVQANPQRGYTRCDPRDQLEQPVLCTYHRSFAPPLKLHGKGHAHSSSFTCPRRPGG